MNATVKTIIDTEQGPKLNAANLNDGLEKFLSLANLPRGSFEFHGTARRVVLKAKPSSVEFDKVHTLSTVFSQAAGDYFDFPISTLTSGKPLREIRSDPLDIIDSGNIVEVGRFPLHVLSPNASATAYTTVMGLCGHVGMLHKNGRVSGATPIVFPVAEGDKIIQLQFRDRRGKVVITQDPYELLATFSIVLSR